jgi:hypothetical protein
MSSALLVVIWGSLTHRDRGDRGERDLTAKLVDGLPFSSRQFLKRLFDISFEFQNRPPRQTSKRRKHIARLIETVLVAKEGGSALFWFASSRKKQRKFWLCWACGSSANQNPISKPTCSLKLLITDMDILY